MKSEKPVEKKKKKKRETKIHREKIIKGEKAKKAAREQIIKIIGDMPGAFGDD